MTTSSPGAYPTATSPPAIPSASRFLLRADRGFLAASHSIEGPPIHVTPSPENATKFVDLLTAIRRARALTELGWLNLRVVELRSRLPRV